MKNYGYGLDGIHQLRLPIMSYGDYRVIFLYAILNDDKHTNTDPLMFVMFDKNMNIVHDISKDEINKIQNSKKTRLLNMPMIYKTTLNVNTIDRFYDYTECTIGLSIAVNKTDRSLLLHLMLPNRIFAWDVRFDTMGFIPTTNHSYTENHKAVFHEIIIV